MHVFVDAASRIEVSARDVRSRIAAEPSKGRVATSTNKGHGKEKDPNESVSSMDDVSVKSVDASLTESENNSKKTRLVKHKPKKVKPQETLTVIYCTLMSSQVSILLKDDVADQENIIEVLRISLDNFVICVRPKIDLSEKLRALDYKVKEWIEVVLFVGDAQIDNQLYSDGKYDFPVILVRQDVERAPKLSALDPIERTIQVLHNNALFSINSKFEKTNSSWCLCSSYVKLDPITLYAEDTVYYSLMEILKAFLPVPPQKTFKFKNKMQNTTDNDDDDEDKLPVTMRLPNQVLLKSIEMAYPIQITDLMVEPISILLSVHASIKLYVALDQSPLHFNGYKRSELMTTSYNLGHNMAMHYLSGALFRAGWVVGSLDILGNPGGFARTVGSGVRDFVQFPYEGILQGPWAFVTGITHGSLSLVKHLTAGTVTSLTNMASSVARNMERLSLDRDHSDRSEAGRRTRTNGIAHGIVQGLSAFGISILGAIGGLAHQPIQAVINEGISPSSVVSGVGRGLVGVLTKPIGGAADLLVHTGQGLLQGAGWKQQQLPRCPPIREPHSAGINAPLKLAWKLLAALPLECRLVMTALDATLHTPAGSYMPVTVLLTPQVSTLVFIIPELSKKGGYITIG